MDRNIVECSITMIISIFSITNTRHNRETSIVLAFIIVVVVVMMCALGRYVTQKTIHFILQYNYIYVMQVCMFNTITLSLYHCNINTFWGVCLHIFDNMYIAHVNCHIEFCVWVCECELWIANKVDLFLTNIVHRTVFTIS